MDQARWKRMEAVLDGALELPPADRRAYIDAECGDDTGLRDDVLRMLEAAGASEGFLESDGPSRLQDALKDMVAATGDTEETEDVTSSMPKVVGPYRLIRPLGKGGMGQVYLAVRDDEAFKRYVAVKVIKRGMDSDEILKRFRVERQILASLTHPNIARLLDGGQTEDGVSYFVMEYVDGERIDRYCDEHRLPLEARLDLFEKVCSAVHYAHQNLIVHRDLKPANVLVTATGEVKLLDFGIAKFLNPDLTGYTLPMTREELRVMTPEYASPEQMRGGNLTTASDVYQLGVLLYELLTGHRPFRFQTMARHEIEKIVLEKEPERPSTAISRVKDESADTSPSSVSEKRRTPLERLRRQLSGDLDRIVLMALRKDMDRRYQSADQLLQDITRYRQGLPVSAQTDSVLYRADRFVRRHKAGVAAGVVIALLLVVATGLSVRYAVDTAAQRNQIALEAQKSQAITAFVVDLFNEASPDRVQGRDMTVRQLVDAGAERITDDPDTPAELQAALRNTIAAVYTELGSHERALDLIRDNIRELRNRLGPDAASPELAEALYRYAYVVDEGSTTREWEEAVQLYEEALAMQRMLYGRPSAEAAQTLNDMAVSHMRLRQDSTAEALLQAALAERRELYAGDHEDIAETLSNLGTYAANQGDFASAERYYRESLGMSRSVLGDRHPLVADNIYNLGSVLYDLGSLEEARQLLEDAVARRERIYGPDHNETARALSYLGRTMLAQGNFAEAERYLMRTLDIHRANAGEIDFFVGMDLRWLGILEKARGMHADAARWYVQAVNVLGQAGSQAYAALTQRDLASVYLAGGQRNEAIAAYGRAVDMMAALWGEEDADVAEAAHTLGTLLLEEGRSAEAERVLTRSLDAYLALDMETEASAVRRSLSRLSGAPSQN
jgi:serine/threonine-protein kinase